MIPNITTGVASAFQATARYDLNPEKGYLLKTNCASQDADGIAREMEVQSSSSRTKQPMFHMSVRLPPGESLDDEKWAAVGEGLLNKMGINTDNHMYLITRHTDIKDGDHIHLLASKVDENGKSRSEERRVGKEC